MMSTSKTLVWEEDWPSLRIDGKGVRNFLNGQVTSNLIDVKEGLVIRTCRLNVLGKLKSILEIRFNSNGADVVVLSGSLEDVYNDFEERIFPADRIDSLRRDKIRRLEIISKESIDIECQIFFSPFYHELFDDPRKMKIASKREVEIWRLKKALPIGKGEVDLDANPLELGLMNLVDLDKGCYVGQEVIAKLSRATFLRQEIRFWNSDQLVEEGSYLFDFSTKKNEIVKAGVVTSSLFLSKDLGSIGLAIVQRDYLEKGQLLLKDSLSIVNLVLPPK